MDLTTTDLSLGRVLAGDCIEGMATLPAGCARLVVCDPPFNIGYEYDTYDDKRPMEDYLEWCRQWGEQVVRVLATDGSFWLMIGDEVAAELKVLFQRELGLTCRSWCIWAYTFGVSCTQNFARAHTHLLYFVKDRKNFVFNDADVRMPSARQVLYNDKRANSKGKIPDNVWLLRPVDMPGGWEGRDVWPVARVCGTFKERVGWHPCQMPMEIFDRIIATSSNPGDIVLDPMSGSATSLCAAKRLGRQFIGWELSAEYAAKGQERVDAEPVAGRGQEPAIA